MELCSIETRSLEIIPASFVEVKPSSCFVKVLPVASGGGASLLASGKLIAEDLYFVLRIRAHVTRG